MIEAVLAISLVCLGVAIFFFIKLLFDLKIAKRRQSRKCTSIDPDLLKAIQDFTDGLQEGLRNPDPEMVKRIQEAIRERTETAYENEDDFRIDFIDISCRADRSKHHAVSRKHKESR